MWRALMTSSSSTNHLNRESYSALLYLEMSIFSNSGRRVYRPGSISLLLFQHFKLLSTLSPNSSVYEKLVGNQGYLFPFSVKFILYELGNGGVLYVWTQSFQHCAYGFLTYSSISIVRRHPIRFDSNGSSSHAWDGSRPLHHPPCPWSLGGLLGGTRCNGAPLACTFILQATYTEHRVSRYLVIARTRTCRVRFQYEIRVRTVISIVNLLLISPISSSFNDA